MNHSDIEKPKVLKESKNKIRVEFERTSRWTRFRVKYLNGGFVASALFKIFRSMSACFVAADTAILHDFIAGAEKIIV